VPSGTVGVAYSQALTASGGTTPYSFALASGGPLAPGLTLSGSGVLSGTPTATGTFTFVVNTTDLNGCTGTQSYTNNIGPAAGLLAGLSGTVSQTIRKTFSGTLRTVSGGVTVINNSSKAYSAKTALATGRVKFYLCSSRVVDATAKVLSDQAVGTLAAHKSKRFTFTATIPSTTVVAGRYVIAVIDGNYVVVLGQLH